MKRKKYIIRREGEDADEEKVDIPPVWLTEARVP